jgi:hypothetical protein
VIEGRLISRAKWPGIINFVSTGKKLNRLKNIAR